MLRKGMAIAAGIALVGAATIVVWAHWALWRPLDNREVDLVVADGTPAGQVLNQLHDAGLLPSRLAGRLYLRVVGGGRTPRWGSYRFPARCRPADAIEWVLEGRVETVSVTVVEGSRSDEITEVYVAAGIGSSEEWREVIARADWIDDVASSAPSLEGFLFPDTYRFAVGLSVAGAARHMLDRFREVWAEEVEHSPPLWTSPLAIVTLASLVEAETSVPEERPRIAGVFRNRLRRGMLLQCDPTVAYALRRRGEWQGRLLRRHWATDDPYNTYRYPGLPPGPINSPGRAALAAALAPEENGYLYFVASPDGGHTFSRTMAEHEAAVARWMASRK